MRKRQVVVRREEPSSYTIRNVRYGECQKNHAAGVGGYAVDGCREFMASGEEGTAALTCAACGCHRNFHRREVETVCECSSPTSTEAWSIRISTSTSFIYLIKWWIEFMHDVVLLVMTACCFSLLLFCGFGFLVWNESSRPSIIYMYVWNFGWRKLRVWNLISLLILVCSTKKQQQWSYQKQKQHLHAVLLYLILDLFVNYLCSWCTCNEM